VYGILGITCYRQVLYPLLSILTRFSFLLLLLLLATFFCSKKTAQEQANAQAQSDSNGIDLQLNATFTFGEKVVNEIQQNRLDTT